MSSAGCIQCPSFVSCTVLLVPRNHGTMRLSIFLHLCKLLSHPLSMLLVHGIHHLACTLWIIYHPWCALQHLVLLMLILYTIPTLFVSCLTPDSQFSINTPLICLHKSDPGPFCLLSNRGRHCGWFGRLL